MDTSEEAASSARYWASLCPELTVGRGAGLPPPRALPPADAAAARARVLRDGYAALGPD